MQRGRACKSLLTSGRVCMRRDDTNERGNFQISSGDNGRFPGRDYDIATPSIHSFAGYHAQILSRDDRERDKTRIISNSTTVEFRQPRGDTPDRCKVAPHARSIKRFVSTSKLISIVLWLGFERSCILSCTRSFLRIVYLIYELVIGRSVIKYRASYITDILRTLWKILTISFEFLRLGWASWDITKKNTIDWQISEY